MSREINKEEALKMLENDIEHILLGNVLTIIDASISDKQQNKALKDLIRNEFFEIVASYRRWLGGDTPQICNEQII